MFLSFFFILMLLSVLLFTYGLAGFGDFLRALHNAAWFFKRSQARINAEWGNSYQKKRELMKKLFHKMEEEVCRILIGSLVDIENIIITESRKM